MRRLPPLNTLRVFDAAARCLNFSVAAQELCVTHSAVSHQIRQLEDWLGQPLFIRHASGVRLTAAGQNLQEASSHALQLLETRCREIAGSKPTQEIVLGASGSFLANWLIPRLDRFETAHPDMRIRLQTSAAISELHAQRVDALIVSGQSWPQTIEVTRLFDERIGPVCAPDWPHRLQLPSALREQPLLHTSSHITAWPIWAQGQGLDPAAFTAGRQFDHLPLMLEAAAAGLGIGIAPALLVEREIVRHRLIAPLGFANSGAVFALCTLRDRKDGALMALREWLKQEGECGSASEA